MTDGVLQAGFSCPQCKAALQDYALSCKSCGADLRGVELRTDNTLNNSINRKERSIFYYVSPLKLVLMSISTLGIYQLFWFYKNWTYVDEHTNKLTSPTISAIFGGISFYGLMNEMNKAGAETGSSKKLPSLLIAPLYFLLLLSSSLHGFLGCLGLLASLCLLPAQIYINSLNADSPTPINDKFSVVNWVVIVIGMGIQILAIIGRFMK